MAETTFEKRRDGKPMHRTVPVPGYAIDEDSKTNYAFEHQSSHGWRLVGTLVQALLVVLVVLAALATVGWV